MLRDCCGCFLSFNQHEMWCVPKEAAIVFSEDTVGLGRADQQLTGNSAVPVAFVPQGYTCLLLGSLDQQLQWLTVGNIRILCLGRQGSAS